MGLSALLAAWVFTATSETMSVMVAARDIAPGEVIDASDLRVVEMGRTSGLRAIQPSQQDLIIGRAARGPIPDGTVLNTDLFAEKGQVIPAGFVVIGASLDAGAAPTSRLSPGDQVDLLGVVKSASATPGDTATATLLGSGTVWSVERLGSGATSSKVWVSVLVPSDVQAAVAQAAADGRLRLSLRGAGG
ncbi:MAG: SAF domain-containing protein [Acidimicrobiia bacterium]